MAYSNFIQTTAGLYFIWNGTNGGNYGVPNQAAVITKMIDVLGDSFDGILVANETANSTFTIMDGVTVPIASAFLVGVKGTNLRFMFYCSPDDLRTYISVFNGLSLVGTYKQMPYCQTTAYMYARVVSSDLAMITFVENMSSAGSMIITRYTNLSGEEKAVILLGINQSNTIQYFDEDGRTGSFVLPNSEAISAIGEYVGLIEMIIPSLGVVKNVYFTTQRSNSNSQIISTGNGVFATLIGNDSYTQVYIKCPTA